MSEDERAIRGLVENWMAATKAGDVEAVLALIADDVVFMVPGAEPFGKQAFAGALAGLGQFTIEGRSEIRELQLMGNFAYLRNQIDMSATSADGKSVRRSGYTLTILRKEADGRWRLARDANLLTERP
ncbi:YybH family protein [Bosea sp. (in: a-proteobacteria)]|uniref:YybH family protein n=1 Tax=Bosea sp. (in: a-proteobacteria) TaxID=1871050 RepID=UPI002FCB4824